VLGGGDGGGGVGQVGAWSEWEGGWWGGRGRDGGRCMGRGVKIMAGGGWGGWGGGGVRSVVTGSGDVERCLGVVSVGCGGVW